MSKNSKNKVNCALHEDIIPHIYVKEKPFLSTNLKFVQVAQNICAKILKFLHTNLLKGIDFFGEVRYNIYA